MAKNTGLGVYLVALAGRVASHFNESDWQMLGTLTEHDERIERHPRLLRSMRFGDPDYEGNVLSMIQEMIKADSDNLGEIENYLARKYPDSVSGENVSSHNEPVRQIVFAPSVFKVPDAAVDRSLVSVMMPINAGTAEIYTAIKGAADDASLKCERADDIWIESPVIQDIFSLIFRSFIVVCDFSGKNPNVFYEAGIAHTLGKHVIPITQSEDDIPFDLRHHRYLRYLNNREGRTRLRSELAKRLRTLSEG